MERNPRYWLGMLASIAVALSASADQFPDGRWKHTLQIAGLLGTAINGYLIQRRPDAAIGAVVPIYNGGQMSKTETVNKWLAIAQMIAPAVLMAVPGGEKVAPFVPVIIGGITEAEQIPGATGAEKKAHVLDLAMAAFTTLQATGKVHLGTPEDFQATVGAGIDATVGTINIVHATHGALPPGVLIPPAAPAAAGS